MVPQSSTYKAIGVLGGIGPCEIDRKLTRKQALKTCSPHRQITACEGIIIEIEASVYFVVCVVFWMDVSENGGFGTPAKSSIFHRDCPLFSPSILVVLPLFLETP